MEDKVKGKVEGAKVEEVEDIEVRITIIYDNRINSEVSDELKKRLKSDWGFSALIEIKDNKILFDAGAKYSVLKNNMDVLGIKPEEIDFIFISHYHKDHYGGLFKFLEENQNTTSITVFLPKGFGEREKNRIIKLGASVVETTKLSRLFKNIATTGPMGTNIKEQSMIIMTTKGAVVITGCAHPGIIDIVRSVRVLTKDIQLVMGGFHLLNTEVSEIKNIIKELTKSSNKICPCHCSGDETIRICKEEFKEQNIEGGVGKVIEL